MHREEHGWFSHRLGRHMNIVVHGHWGPPMMLFPTSGGDEGEYERQSLIGAIGDLIEAGRVKTFCVNLNHGDGFANRGAHPSHRSWMQRQYDEYIRHEVIPFVRHHCQSADAAVWTMGASLGAYHAANTLFKYPDVVKRCFALSGVYDMSRFMDGVYDENFYFNNPVDYLANASDPWMLGHLATCDIHIATGSGPWEQSAESYRLSRVLASRGIRHHLDDWGPMGGHDWPYWKHQMREYLRHG
jgi:esterase/lipase superfamily enzyme